MNLVLTQETISQVEGFVNAFNVWMAVLYIPIILGGFIVNLIRKKKLSLPIFKYSIFNTYLFLSVFAIAALLGSLSSGGFSYFMWFVIVGFVGMAAEATYSYVWRLYFKKNNWTYTELPIFNAFTSWYNFIPWSVGLMIFLRGLTVLSDYFVLQDFIYVSLLYLIVAAGITVVQGVVGYIRKRNNEAYDVPFSIGNFMLFSLPLIFPIILITMFFGLEYLIFSLICGLLAFILEYLYGKVMDLLFGRQYWTYSYITLDGDHTSPTNFFGAIVAGFLFVSVFLIGTIIW
jgi:hypothetical protein